MKDKDLLRQIQRKLEVIWYEHKQVREHIPGEAPFAILKNYLNLEKAYYEVKQLLALSIEEEEPKWKTSNLLKHQSNFLCRTSSSLAFFLGLLLGSFCLQLFHTSPTVELMFLLIVGSVLTTGGWLALFAILYIFRKDAEREESIERGLNVDA